MKLFSRERNGAPCSYNPSRRRKVDNKLSHIGSIWTHALKNRLKGKTRLTVGGGEIFEAVNIVDGRTSALDGG